uniref:Uncharacterized protein n=1 Tax=Rhodnius prolixus TaxID=13249 RepID=T1HUR0_RHOPR
MAAHVQSGLATGSEGLVCFVCDVGVVGRYYALATCRTQTTKVRLIEKLGQLVGDDYMVVISEDDIICRGCATMINSLDRLEKELGSLRSMVLRYLEKKYDLEDGELVNTRSNPPPTPAKSNKGVTDVKITMLSNVDSRDSKDSPLRPPLNQKVKNCVLGGGQLDFSYYCSIASCSPHRYVTSIAEYMRYSLISSQTEDSRGFANF